MRSGVCCFAPIFYWSALKSLLISSESAATPKGWAAPFVPSLLGTSLVLIVSFVLWELRRERRGQSVLLPMSIWTQPGAKMGPIILLVFFGWWGFNIMGYFSPLFFQEVLLLTPLQTALRLVPMGVAVSSTFLLLVGDEVDCVSFRDCSRTSPRDISLAWYPGRL